MTPYETALLTANREAMHRDTAGNPLPAGQRRRLSKRESYAIAESVRQQGGFGESKSDAGLRESAPAGPASVVVPGFIERIAAEVASRTGRLAGLETDPARLSEMTHEDFAAHVGAVTEAVEMATAPLPPARLDDPRKLAEMSDAAFRDYSIALHSAPQRLTPSPNRRVGESVDVIKLTEVAGSTPSTVEESFEAMKTAYEGVGRRLRSPFWR
jgi:hypothetical protein